MCESSLVKRPSIQIVRWFSLRTFNLCLSDFRRDRSDDRGRYFVLNLKNVVERAIVPFGP